MKDITPIHANFTTPSLEVHHVEMMEQLITHDAFEVLEELGDTFNFVLEVEEEVEDTPNPEAKKFFELMEYARRKLFSGTHHSVLSITS